MVTGWTRSWTTCKQRVLNDTPPTPDERAALFAARAQPDGNPGTVAFPSRLLSLVLDTDDGRGNRHQGVRRGSWDPADDLHHHRAEEPDGADERPVAELWRLLGHRRRDGSVFVGMVVTAAAENWLRATRIDPFPEPAW